MTMRVMVATPRYRYHGRSIVSVHQAIRHAVVPVEYLELANDQPFGDPQPGQNGNRNILYLYQMIRERFLASACTHLLTVEDDMVIPQDVIPELLRVDAPVVYATYTWRRGPPHAWNCYRHVSDDNGVSWMDDAPEQCAAWAREGRVIDVVGVGLGCTLIERQVLEAIEFRLPRGGRAANDWYFAIDCQQHGFAQKAHLGLRCGHIRDDPSVRIIWPDETADTNNGKHRHRYEYLEYA